MAKNYTFVRGAAFPYQYKYEHPAVTTDCVIFTYEDWKLKVLLVKRGGEPYKGEWALPGGFLRGDETAREGALRELKEETALEASAIGELGVFSDPSRDPRERVITIAFYALVKPSKVQGGLPSNASRRTFISSPSALTFWTKNSPFRTCSGFTRSSSASSSTAVISSGKSSPPASWKRPRNR